jgi:alpha-glucosidase (family GH31 glycosyl hydrolase)
MIGGGDSKDFRDPNYKGMGTELFIRWTQASALMPMMQFSYAPWNLDADALKICRKYAKLHEELGGYIYELALKNQKTGDPIVRPLFYDNTEDEQAYLVSDQFMLGDRFLVAPVLEKGAVKRNIYLPKGLWKDYWTNTIYAGGVSIVDYHAPIDVLPIMIKLD